MTYATGILCGNIITLDKPLPSLEGKRVRVAVEQTDGAQQIALSPAEQDELWKNWMTSGPQGPIEDEDEVNFP